MSSRNETERLSRDFVFILYKRNGLATSFLSQEKSWTILDISTRQTQGLRKMEQHCKLIVLLPQTLHRMRPVNPTVGVCLESGSVTESPRLPKGIPDSPRGTKDR